MTDKAKSWMKSNIMEIIITILISAFFTSYQVDRANDSTWKETIIEKFDDHEGRLLSLEYINIILNDNLDDWQKQALLEYARKRTGIKKE